MNGVTVYNRVELREAMTGVPHEVNIVISAIAERSCDWGKRELWHLYLNEPEEKRVEALQKLRKIRDGMNEAE